MKEDKVKLLFLYSKDLGNNSKNDKYIIIPATKEKIHPKNKSLT